MNAVVASLADIIVIAIKLYIYALIALAVLSWLIAFNVVNMRNRAVAVVTDTLYRLTEPVLRPIRNILPDLGGIDISPVILILILIFVQNLVIRLAYGY